MADRALTGLVVRIKDARRNLMPTSFFLSIVPDQHPNSFVMSFNGLDGDGTINIIMSLNIESTCGRQHLRKASRCMWGGRVSP